MTWTSSIRRALAADTSWGMHLGSATSSATQYQLPCLLSADLGHLPVPKIFAVRSRGAFIRC